MPGFDLLRKRRKEELLPVVRAKDRTIPLDEERIGIIAERAKRMVTTRALVSAGASVLPIPGLDVAVDIGVMATILNSVNQEFGLTPDQIARLPTEQRLRLFGILTMAGSTSCGKVITKTILMSALSKVGVKLTASQATKWVPIVGSALSATISFSALKYIGNQHISDCVRIARDMSIWYRAVYQEEPEPVEPESESRYELKRLRS